MPLMPQILQRLKKRIRHLVPFYTTYKRAFWIGFALLAATNATAATIPYLMKLATDALQQPELIERVPLYAAALALLAILTALLRIWARTHIFRIGREVECAMRGIYHAKLHSLEASLFDQARTGDLVSRGTGDITALRMFMGPGFLQIANATLVYLIVLPVMLMHNATLTLIALLPLPIVLFTARALTRRLYKLSRVVADRFGGLSAFVQESVAGISVIRAHAQEPHWNGRFHDETESLYHAHRDHAHFQGMFQPLMLFSGGIGVWIILAYGGPLVAHGELTVGDFVAFTGYLTLLVQPTVALGWIMTVLQRGLAAIDRISQVLDIDPLPHNAATEAVPQQEATPNAIAIEDLTFRYHKERRLERLADEKSHLNIESDVLKKISLDVPHGAFIGLAGRIGSGKSSLLRAIARLYPSPAGTILVDGVPLESLSEGALRRHIAMTPQESLLFSRPLGENLLYGVPNEPDSTAWEAADQAAFSDEVRGMPEEMATLIGERGITLSGGQRQRAALARALANQPKVLLLDDIFASVDARTEADILDSLMAQQPRPTIMMVCHRVAALHKADAIYLLDDGEIVATGTHGELLADNLLYQRLHNEMARQEALEEIQ
uniref:Putative ABC transporter ATP-binding/permease protein n=1 Tax=Magnetococcus massalia (strain MO-1) TaxID=451514 RepID=A0A1S7LDM6_MAGMO|nr:putative ABC transporter ATP-binding/permease protein [Candidatus Magnetococcus massalia]